MQMISEIAAPKAALIFPELMHGVSFVGWMLALKRIPFLFFVLWFVDLKIKLKYSLKRERVFKKGFWIERTEELN